MPLWCDLGHFSQTVVVIKLLRSSALALFSNSLLLQFFKLDLFNCCLFFFFDIVSCMSESCCAFLCFLNFQTSL